MSSLADWARWYAQRGFTPVRLRPGEKVPIDGGWQRQQFATPDDAATFVADHGGNLGISPSPGLVVLDLDRKNGADGVATVASLELQFGPLPATLTQRTPSNGEHRVFALPPGVSVPNGVGVAPGVDVRAQGGQIVAYPSKLVDGRAWRWVEPSASIAPLPELWARFLATRPQRRAVPSAAAQEGRIPEGGRNDALTRRAGAMRAAGVSHDALLLALSDMNQRECDPPLPPAELATIPASVCRYAPRPEPWEAFAAGQPLPPGALPVPAGRAPRISVADLETRRPAPPKFRIDGILPAGMVTLLSAHGGAGKSMLALTAAACMAAGRPFLGLPTDRCRVVFYSAEDGEQLVRWRMRAICAHLGLRPAELDGHLLLLDATENPVLYDGKGHATDALAGLRFDVAEFRPGAIVVDNASDTFDANEIERARVREFVRLLVTLGKSVDAAVLLLAHVDKATVKNGGREGYSGSTAWHNSARSRLVLNVDSLTNCGTLEQHKSNLGKPLAPIHVRRTAEGLLELSDGAAVPGGLDDRTAVLQAVTAALAEGVAIPASSRASPNAYALLHKRPGFPPFLAGRTFWQLLASLIGSGEIAEVEEPSASRGHVRRVLRTVSKVA